MIEYRCDRCMELMNTSQPQYIVRFEKGTARAKPVVAHLCRLCAEHMMGEVHVVTDN